MLKKKEATFLRKFKLKVLFQIAIHRRETPSIKRLVRLASFYLAMACLKPMIHIYESRNPLKYLFLAFWPVVMLSLFSGLLIFALVVLTFSQLTKFVTALSSLSNYVFDYGFLSVIYRSSIALLTLGAMLIVGLIWGFFANGIVIYISHYTSLGFIFDYALFVAAIFLSIVMVTFLKSIRKETPSFKEFASGIEEEYTDYEQSILRNEKGKSSLLTNRMLGFIHKPYNMMLTCFFIAICQYNLLLHVLSILLIKFPEQLILYKGMEKVSGVYLGSLYFLAQQTLEVLPLTVFKSFLSVDMNIKILKPWGTVVQLLVQSVIIAILLIVGATGLFYINFWRNRRK